MAIIGQMTKIPITEFNTITRREYFACYILAGMLSGNKAYTTEEAIKQACDMADALITECDTRAQNEN